MIRPLVIPYDNENSPVKQEDIIEKVNEIIEQLNKEEKKRSGRSKKSD